MNWRAWVYETLIADTDLLALVPAERILSTYEEVPADKPFIVIRFDATVRDVGDDQGVVIWVHDEPLGYTRIDAVIQAIKNALVGPVAQPDAILCDWAGDSGDLSDDAQGTVLRTSSYRLLGRRSA